MGMTTGSSKGAALSGALGLAITDPDAHLARHCERERSNPAVAQRPSVSFKGTSRIAAGRSLRTRHRGRELALVRAGGSAGSPRCARDDGGGVGVGMTTGSSKGAVRRGRRSGPVARHCERERSNPAVAQRSLPFIQGHEPNCSGTLARNAVLRARTRDRRSLAETLDCFAALATTAVELAWG